MGNSHYTASSPTTVPTSLYNQLDSDYDDDEYAPTNNMYWALPLTALIVKGSGGNDEFIAGQNFSSCGSSCFIDSGTPELVIPNIVLEAVLAAEENATLEVVLQHNPYSKQYVLTFPARDLQELREQGMVATSEE